MKNPYLSLIATVWHYGVPWRKSIVGYYIAYVMAQAILSLNPYIFGRAVDVLQNFVPNRLVEEICWLGASIAVLLFFWLFHGPARVIERKVALKIQQTFRLSIYEQLTLLPLVWHQNHHSGSIITRLNRASTALYRFAEDQFIYVEVIVQFFMSIVFLLWLSVPVGLLSLSSSFVVFFTIFLFDRKLIPLYDKQNEIDNYVGAGFFDYISNMTTVLTLRLGELTHANLSQRLSAVWPFFRQDTVLNETKWFTMGILLTIVQATLLIGYIVYTLHVTGTIMIGLVVMIAHYQWDLTMVFYKVSEKYSDLVHMNTDIKGMDPILEDIKKLAHLPQDIATIKQWHTLQITDLSFHHSNNNETNKIFKQIKFTIKRGEKIALIGASGGGKSTLMNVLCGLYTPSNVCLTVDEKFFDSLEPLKAITTMIPQDPEIFENTISFNITLGLPSGIDEIYSIARLAGFLPVLNKLPSGLATDIREKGLNLSVGQKQRLALARGLFAARFSSLILMDEPTSSVDLPTEKEILSDIIDTFSNVAMIVSLHRLHLLPKFDSVIMLQHGKIVAQGLTTELLHKPGPVRDLWEIYGVI